MGYPKLAADKDCAFPERKECNYGEGCERCEYMKYDNSKSTFDQNRWFCKFKRNNDTLKEKDKGVKKESVA